MNFVDRQVCHQRFGRGRIQSHDDKTVTVWFEQYGSRTFIYPDVFASFLRTEDTELAQEVAQVLAQRAEEKAAEKAAMKPVMIRREVEKSKPVRKTAARKKSKT